MYTRKKERERGGEGGGEQREGKNIRARNAVNYDRIIGRNAEWLRRISCMLLSLNVARSRYHRESRQGEELGRFLQIKRSHDRGTLRCGFYYRVREPRKGRRGGSLSQ
jgi:hypothetical protein